MKAEHLMGVVVVTMAAAIFLGGRPLLPANTPRVDAIETLSDAPNMKQVRRYTEYGSGILPYNKREIEIRAKQPADPRPPLRIGWSYREVSFFGLPIWAYEEYGFVTFLEEPMGYKIAILPPPQLELLQELTGKSYSGRHFPWWKHIWGWVFALGLGAVIFLQLREQARWREEQGII